MELVFWVNNQNQLVIAEPVRAAGQVFGRDPGFADAAASDFRLTAGSRGVDAGIRLPESLAAEHPLRWEYVPHQRRAERLDVGPPDLGAFECR